MADLLTLKGSLTLFPAATPENQSLWIHRGKMLRGLESQSNIGPYNNNGLACKIDVFHWGYLPPLILDEVEKGELSHDIRRRTQPMPSITLTVTLRSQQVSNHFGAVLLS
jgi:hypothetical protein